MNRMLAAAALAVALSGGRSASAQANREIESKSETASPPAPTGTPACAGPLEPSRVVACALAISPEVSEARQRIAAGAGRRKTAGTWLPSNPVVSGSVAQRRRDGAENLSVLNWNVSVAQELEIAGQRGARIAVADAEAAALARRLAVAEQEIAAAALTAFFDALAAHEALTFADDLVQSARALATVAEARAKEALLSGVEAHVAQAEAVRIGLLRAEAARRWEASRADLAVLLGRAPQSIEVPALAGVTLAAPDLSNPQRLEAQALQLRGEIASAEIERKVLEQRVALHRRERVPNLTLSAFAERGEIDDRVLGVGLSIPLPLPAPIGRTRAGEIAETLAQVRAAGSSLDLVRRRVRTEVAHAVASLAARQEARGLFDPTLLARARADLLALREALATRQLALRDAVVWQRSLIDLQAADIETRLGRELAVIELRRVVGLPLGAVAGGPR